MSASLTWRSTSFDLSPLSSERLRVGSRMSAKQRDEGGVDWYRIGDGWRSILAGGGHGEDGDCEDSCGDEVWWCWMCVSRKFERRAARAIAQLRGVVGDSSIGSSIERVFIDIGIDSILVVFKCCMFVV